MFKRREPVQKVGICYNLATLITLDNILKNKEQNDKWCSYPQMAPISPIRWKWHFPSSEEVEIIFLDMRNAERGELCKNTFQCKKQLREGLSAKPLQGSFNEKAVNKSL